LTYAGHAVNDEASKQLPRNAESLVSEAEKIMNFMAQISQESLAKWKDIATIIGVLIAIGTLIFGLVTLISGFIEYKKQGAQKRFERLAEIKKWFYEREVFQQIAL
jgi:hypothetical protein